MQTIWSAFFVPCSIGLEPVKLSLCYNSPMPHIHTEPGQIDHTASAYIVRIDGDEPRIMLHRHKLLGMFLQFGGHIELGETPWQAIIHEVKEESGYDIDQLQILQPRGMVSELTDAVMHPYPLAHLTHRFPGRAEHYHSDISYAFVASEAPSGTVSDDESSEMVLLSVDQLHDLDPEEIPEDVRELAHFVLCIFKDPDWQAVPAATFSQELPR
jgi:8-oxo-dGTP pyrophosphatase MutT (NUDIX family)